MKLISFTIFSILSYASFSFTGAYIDLEKFTMEAKNELRAQGLSDDGSVYFQDGMIGGNMTVDGKNKDLGELYFVSENSIANFSVAYILNLSDGTIELGFLGISDNSRREAASAGMVFSFDHNASLSMIVNDLSKKFPNVKHVVLGGTLNVYVREYTHFNEVKEAVSYIKETFSPARSYFNERFNAFNQPVYGALQPIVSLNADLDLLRDIVPAAISAGAVFGTDSTTIPERMKL